MLNEARQSQKQLKLSEQSSLTIQSIIATTTYYDKDGAGGRTASPPAGVGASVSLIPASPNLSWRASQKPFISPSRSCPTTLCGAKGQRPQLIVLTLQTP